MASQKRAWSHEVPVEGWLVSSRNGAGQREWFVRFKLKGLYPRRNGPFSSEAEATNHYNERVLGFQTDTAGGANYTCVVEDELASAYLKRRSRKRSAGRQSEGKQPRRKGESD